VNLPEHGHARVEVLDDVEEEHGGEGAGGEGQLGGDVPREDAGAGEPPLADLPGGDGQLRGIVVDADDRPAARRRANEVSAVAAADVEDGVAGPEVRQVPVVPGMIDEVLGMDHVRPLPGEPDQARAH
jgi:hypothetical protein